MFSVLCLLSSVLCFPASARAVDEAIDSVMYTDPDIPTAKVVKVFPPRLLSLWLQALERPENDLKCQAAATIALAHRRGMPGLDPAVGPLLGALDKPEQHPTVRLAVAQALIGLDARQAADSLFRQAQTGGIELRNLVEPALARWDYTPARSVWLERLGQQGLPGRSWVLALQGLATVRELKAVPRLRELVRSPTTDPIIRIEAARALGLIQTTGSEKEAERLASEKTAPARAAHLCAASMLRKHRSDEAVKILQRLAVESEPSAAAVALEGLLDIDPRLIQSLLPRVLASPDAKVRGLGVEAHLRTPLPDHLPLVAELLDDPHPGVRISARKALEVVARIAGHGDAVRQQATKLLATGRWRGLEQATILLAVLNHKPAAGRFVELLRFERPEVFVAAAWGLRKLAVAETLPAQLSEIDRRWQASLKYDSEAPHAMIDAQVAQLAQSLGLAKYAPGGPVLARFIPKQANIGPTSRTAAIWALGLIHAKAPPHPLVDALVDRMTDDSVIMPEDLRVRRMSAVGLGRMHAEMAVDSLRKYYPRKLSTEQFPNACGWALQQITGEQFPTTGTAELVQRGWFLEPND